MPAPRQKAGDAVDFRDVERFVAASSAAESRAAAARASSCRSRAARRAAGCGRRPRRFRARVLPRAGRGRRQRSPCTRSSRRSRARGACVRVRHFPPFPADHRDRARERVDRIQLDAVDQRRFVRVLGRHDEFREAGVARAQHHRQDAADRLQRSIEREFAERDELLQREPVDLFVDGDQRERDREIECRPRLTHVGRRRG